MQLEVYWIEKAEEKNFRLCLLLDLEGSLLSE